MGSENRRRPQEIRAWRFYGLPDYAPIRARLPLEENSLTHLAPAPSTFDSAIVSNSEVTVARSLINAISVGRTVLRPGFLGFYVPMRWNGVLKINGVSATPTAIHLPVDDVHFHIHSRERDLLGCILPRARFIETIAALHGVEPDESLVATRALELTPGASRVVREGLQAILEKGMRARFSSVSNCAASDLTNEVFELMVGIYLQARQEPLRKSEHAGRSARIVRAAEERFAQAGGKPVSLADLCVAAGVSQTTLYEAFQSWCGEPPIAYFRKRRLTQARTRLLYSRYRRGAVKETALDLGLVSAGLYEFGRFSRDYRQLFGESPSVTLSRNDA